MNPAIIFEPDGYLTNGEKLMGRQVAGRGFLRAAVQGRAGFPMIGVTLSERSAVAFGRLVAEMDPGAFKLRLDDAGKLELGA